MHAPMNFDKQNTSFKRAKRRMVLALATTIALMPLAAFAHTDEIKNQKIEVAFVLDTTGSMGDLIAGAKRKIWSIANTIVDINPDADIRMGLVGYRDFQDDYVVKTVQMTSDIQGMYDQLNKFRAAGGGDTREAVNEALNAALEQIQWSQDKDTKRIIYLVGDAPPHMDYNGPKYPELVERANGRDIIINAVQAGNSRQTRRVWKHIAGLGQGDYISIPQDGGKVVIIETPFDDDIIILQRKIDQTVLPYGLKEQRSRIKAILQNKAEAPGSVVVDSSKYYSSRSSKEGIVSGRGDLIADVANKRLKLDNLSKEVLPEQLKDKTTTEIEEYVNVRLDVRRQLQKQMAALIKKRDNHVRRVQETSSLAAAPSFDREVEKSLRKILK